MKLILASSSRYRRELLERFGLPFEVAPPDVDEVARPRESARDLVVRLAVAKGASGWRPGVRTPLVVGSDQLASLEGACAWQARPRRNAPCGS